MRSSTRLGSMGPPPATRGRHPQDLLDLAQSWAEFDLTLKEARPSRCRQGRHGTRPAAVTSPVRGPAPAAIPAPSPSRRRPRRPKARVGWGDADFATNSSRLPGHKDFFLNSVAWLAQDVDSSPFRPKEPDDQRMLLNRTQRLVIALASLIGCRALDHRGRVVWWRRR